MGLRSTDDREETCQNCYFSKPVGYRQIICRKDGKWHPELYSCEGLLLKNKSICISDGQNKEV